MSQVFDFGFWLPASAWKVYSRLANIDNPSATWVMIDEHPDSINDAACAVMMAKPDRKMRQSWIGQPLIITALPD